MSLCRLVSGGIKGGMVMIEMYLDMGVNDLGKFLEEISWHINKPNPQTSLSFGDLDLHGDLSITLTPGNKLDLIMSVDEIINKSARGITITINEKGE